MAKRYTIRQQKIPATTVEGRKVARDAKSGKFISGGHSWEIVDERGRDRFVLSTSTESAEAIESIVRVKKAALRRLANK